MLYPWMIKQKKHTIKQVKPISIYTKQVWN